jgi:DNA polymerase-3 subunit chi
MPPPQVDFHSGVADKFGYTCRLVRKAWRAGHRVLVVGHPRSVSRLDALLWTFDPDEFMPHARWGRAPATAQAVALTPVWLAEDAAAVDANARIGVLVNLDASAPPATGGFERVIEVVADDPEDAQRGRARWRDWKALGVSPTNHDQRGRPTAAG